jgi:hypothetical protein
MIKSNGSKLMSNILRNVIRNEEKLDGDISVFNVLKFIGSEFIIDSNILWLICRRTTIIRGWTRRRYGMCELVSVDSGQTRIAFKQVERA